MLSLAQWSMSVNNWIKLRAGKIGLNIREKNYLTKRCIRGKVWGWGGLMWGGEISKTIYVCVCIIRGHKQQCGEAWWWGRVQGVSGEQKRDIHNTSNKKD